MAIADAFGEFYRSNSGLLSTALITLFLIGIEAILDDTFECPSEEYNYVLSAIYSISFFICPGIIFAFIGLIYFPGANKNYVCPCWAGFWNFVYVILHVMKIPVIWLLIAMSDGQFLACFVVAVSRYQLDFHLYLYIFQTSGMLAMTLFCAIWYFTSKATCLYMEESRRTYSLLHDIEGILERNEMEKEKAEDTQIFLEALQKKAIFQWQTLPCYMLEKEDVLVEKLTEEHAEAAAAEAHSGEGGGH